MLRVGLLLAAVLVCIPALPAAEDAAVTLQASNRMPKGWGAGGWGSYRFVLKNTSEQDAVIVKWTAHWEAGGKKVGGSWGGDLNQPLARGAEMRRDEVGVLPQNVVRASGDGAPAMVGSFTIRRGEQTQELPFRFEVPAARLPEPLKTVEAKMVALALMESRYKEFRHLDRTLAWLDQAYQAMMELTGETPFGGKRMVFREAPAHPWWAYAGQEMVLNTDYVASTLKEFDEGILSFGWTHEAGHNFDVLGKWYIWNGPSGEFQANLKLTYAFESIADPEMRVYWSHEAPGYKRPEKSVRLAGHDFIDRFFLLFGDAYLADPKRTWESMSSDEIHSFFQRIQRAYGWEPFRRWYRTYRRLEDAGHKPPEKAEEKVALIAAILSEETKVDLVPLFLRWRFPVTPESVRAMKERYSIGAK